MGCKMDEIDKDIKAAWEYYNHSRQLRKKGNDLGLEVLELRNAFQRLMTVVEALRKPIQDTLGDCLSCGAKNGQPCVRGCGKTK